MSAPCADWLLRCRALEARSASALVAASIIQGSWRASRRADAEGEQTRSNACSRPRSCPSMLVRVGGFVVQSQGASSRQHQRHGHTGLRTCLPVLAPRPPAGAHGHLRFDYGRVGRREQKARRRCLCIECSDDRVSPSQSPARAPRARRWYCAACNLIQRFGWRIGSIQRPGRKWEMGSLRALRLLRRTDMQGLQQRGRRWTECANVRRCGGQALAW